VEALIDAPAAVVHERVGRWANVEPIDESRCRLRMRTENLDWAAAGLGMLGAGFTVLAPPELRDRIGAWAARFSAAAE
jgi:predicted DNA-binding transcriptional regulator YafY